MRIEVKLKAFEAATPLIADLNFSVEEGEIVALIGPSGAGKSTLLNIIAGLDTDYDGNIANVPERPVGLMFQEARLMPWLTALENITLVAPASHPDPQSEAKKLLSLVGLEKDINSYPARLSGGMAKRLALARAMMFNPGVLLMDEPFSSLDAPAAESLRRLLLTLKKEKPFSIIYVTHDLKEAVTIADRVLILDAKPMTIVHQEIISLPRPRFLHDEAVNEVCKPLYNAFPALLYGDTDR
ncbi:ABC transporter ATP-binding protein [Alteromonas confluentis]|uniref:ABC transporter domain-containing protein n=1 Tax=Alteromonas confluentis TaxID=1656094 RepID=A0A1E7ZG31_9ALTE|nr:ABC transporter ATP-binding protein [Alteromonas confluentis]OFC72473.1 hypothetical protein BFC18_02630 [Alteromonas confluentis]